MFSESRKKKLAATYEPQSLVRFRVQGKDAAVKTDKEGRPVLLFLGRADAEGNIKGDRYGWVLVEDAKGAVIKDHWERKGKAS